MIVILLWLWLVHEHLGTWNSMGTSVCLHEITKCMHKFSSTNQNT